MVADTLVFFFDGDCGLCQSSIRFLYRIDRGSRIVFAPLGGETFRELLPKFPILNSGGSWQEAMAFDGETVYLGQEAVLKALRKCKWPWPALAILLGLIPSRARNRAYRFVAERRLLIGISACSIPHPDLKRKIMP